jgi:hypothetical protein
MRTLSLVGWAGPRTPPAEPEALRQWRSLRVARAAERFFSRRPGALGVALGTAAPLRPDGRRWIDAVDIGAPGWWWQAGLPHGPFDAPMLIVAEGLLTRLSPERAQALLWAVGEFAPPGTVLLADAAGARWPLAAPWCLPQRQALCAPHARLRLDGLQRLPGWRARVLELATGVPPWALYEIGVDA